MYKDIIIVILGWIFIVFGIIGLFLPVLQGILFLSIGLYLLSKKSLWAKKLLYKMGRRYPYLFRKIKGVRSKADKYMKRMDRYVKSIGRKK